MGRFRKEKTPEAMLKKFRNLKQKKLMVEDYAHNFKFLNRRL